MLTAGVEVRRDLAAIALKVRVAKELEVSLDLARALPQRRAVVGLASLDEGS